MSLVSLEQVQLLIYRTCSSFRFVRHSSYWSRRRHSFAIDSAGRLYAWGNNSSGQLGTGNINTELTPQMINISSVISADGGAVHSIFLKDNGEVFSCGNNSYGQLGTGGTNSSIPSKIEISGVRQISAGKIQAYSIEMTIVFLDAVVTLKMKFRRKVIPYIQSPFI